MTDLVIYLILPCNIFHSFQIDMTVDLLKQCGAILIICTALQLFYLIINKFAFMRVNEEKRVIMQYSTICNNSGFMGLPVMESVFGATGLLYGSVALIPLRIFMWSVGLSLFTRTTAKQTLKKLVTHPCIWAVILGFLYMAFSIELPAFLNNTISALGGCTTAITMLLVGAILSEVDIKTVLDRDCFYFSAIRLIIIPALLYIVLHLIKADSLVTGVTVLAAAMPAATVTAMLAGKYEKDAQFASKLLFVSTVLSLITLPLWCEILTRF